MENMTIKELAIVAGVSSETVRRSAKKLFPKSLKRGRLTVLTKAQSLAIMEDVKKQNMVQMQPPQPPQQHAQSVEVIAQAVAIAMQSVMMPMMEKLLSSQKALPEPIKQDYYSLTAYCNLKSFKLSFSEAIMHGKQLSKLSKEKNTEVRKIPDERYGKVGSYHTNILDEHFSM